MKKEIHNDPSFFGTDSIPKILLKIAPPVMLALLIQSLYNIVDSFFVGRYSEQGLTALSIVYPLQLIITALAVGTGVGVNTLMAKYYALKNDKKANDTAGSGFIISLILWALFAAATVFFLKPYLRTSASDPTALEYANTYGMIVCIGSIGLFTEGIFSKVHQAEGNMVLPTIAQICGAVFNCIADPILIFGLGPVPKMGVAGAAIATVGGQILAAVITGVKGLRKPPVPSRFLHYTGRIFKLGYPSIIMQSMYTVYIVALNMILVTFCDEAVTVLGLYYKLQTFFFIPLIGLTTCIVPVLSYNYTNHSFDRTREVMKWSFLITIAFMIVGILCFELIPVQLLGIFSKSEKVFEIGKTALRIIGTSFIPATFSLMLPIFFQAIGRGAPSVVLTLLRQIICLVPIFYAFSLLGLDYTWIAFPLSETITTAVGFILYYRQISVWKKDFGYIPHKKI
ncbi:MAG TPA: MATE family efflux transporter [Ruminococcaceae bacterium]|nr:MATE family efflux transporter [Oscillospiraceae bacterium]